MWAVGSRGRNLAARSSGSRASAKRPSFSRDLAQQMQRLAGIGPRLDDAREQGLGAGEIARCRALAGVAAERV